MNHPIVRRTYDLIHTISHFFSESFTERFTVRLKCRDELQKSFCNEATRLIAPTNQHEGMITRRDFARTWARSRWIDRWRSDKRSKRRRGRRGGVSCAIMRERYTVDIVVR